MDFLCYVPARPLISARSLFPELLYNVLLSGATCVQKTFSCFDEVPIRPTPPPVLPCDWVFDTKRVIGAQTSASSIGRVWFGQVDWQWLRQKTDEKEFLDVDLKQSNLSRSDFIWMYETFWHTLKMRLIIHAINNDKHRFPQPLQLLQLVAKRYLSPTQVGSLPCALGGPQGAWGGVRLGRELVLYLDSKEVQLHPVLRESPKSIIRNRLLTDSFSHPTWTFTFSTGDNCDGRCKW